MLFADERGIPTGEKEMKINKKQAKALELLIDKMGEMDVTEGTDNDGSMYIDCECSILKRNWLINDEGECWGANGCVWIDEDQNWVA